MTFTLEITIDKPFHENGADDLPQLLEKAAERIRVHHQHDAELWSDGARIGEFRIISLNPNN